MIKTKQQNKKKLIQALADMTGVGCGGFASPLVGAGFEDEDEEDEEEGFAAEVDNDEGLAAELEDDLGGSDGIAVKKKGVV